MPAPFEGLGGAAPHISLFGHLIQEQRMQRALRVLTGQHSTAQHIRIATHSRIRIRPCTTTLQHLTGG